MREYTVKNTVKKENTALVMGSGDLEVLATPCMTAWMEQAAMRCAEDLLEEGMTTVGTKLEVSHDKATKVGETVETTARLLQQEGRCFTFEVEAKVGDAVIGKGTHVRFAVNRERFMAKLG